MCTLTTTGKIHRKKLKQAKTPRRPTDTGRYKKPPLTEANQDSKQWSGASPASPASRSHDPSHADADSHCKSRTMTTTKVEVEVENRLEK